MPDLSFQVNGVEAALRGLTPLLHFRLGITSEPVTASIQSIMLRAQIQIASPQREYNPREKAKLLELFGQPNQWGQTLRNRLWTNASTLVGPFSGATEALIAVTCTYDLNVAATKYFYALEHGDVPLLFLFSGTIFYRGADNQLQVEPVSWSKECHYHLPIRVWQELMDEHYPNSAWIYLNRDVFDRLYAFRRSHGLATWEQTLERLLPAAKPEEVLA